MSKTLERNAGDAKRSHDPAHRHPVPDAGPSVVELERHEEKKRRPRARRFKHILPLADGDTVQKGDPPSSESRNVLAFTHPAPSEGQGRTMDEGDKQKELIDKIAELRGQNPDRFDRALAEFGFVLAARIVTERGRVRASALPADVVERQRAGSAKRGKKYRDQRSPEKAAAQTAQKIARQKVRRAEKRLAPRPT